jgi:uncharacterized protein
MRRVLSAAAMMVAVLSSPAQPQAPPAPANTAKAEAIRQLLSIQRTDQLILAGVEQAMEAEPADPNLPDGFMEAFVARMRRDIGEFVDRLVPLYDSLYTLDEVIGLTGFYRSPLGQRLLDTQLGLMQSTMQLAQQWGMELAGQVLIELSRTPRRPDEP